MFVLPVNVEVSKVIYERVSFMEDVLIFVQSAFYRLQLRYVDVAVVQEFN